MATIRERVTQAVIDTTISVELETAITVDGKAGWQINEVGFLWDNSLFAVAGDYSVAAYLATETGAIVPEQPEVIAVSSWAAQDTGGVAVILGVEPFKLAPLFEPRITVQPSIFFTLASFGTGIANSGVFYVNYEIVKLSDLEVMRLLAGGA